VITSKTSKVLDRDLLAALNNKKFPDRDPHKDSGTLDLDHDKDSGTLDTDPDPDRRQNLIDWSLGHAPKNSSKSAHNLLKYTAKC